MNKSISDYCCLLYIGLPAGRAGRLHRGRGGASSGEDGVPPEGSCARQRTLLDAFHSFVTSLVTCVMNGAGFLSRSESPARYLLWWALFYGSMHSHITEGASLL